VWRKTNLLWFDCSDTTMAMQQPTQAQPAALATPSNDTRTAL
jgi:hypothetical protein